MAGYRFFLQLTRHRMLFFKRLADDDLGIMSILHEAMDMPVRLVDDLRKISDRDA